MVITDQATQYVSGTYTCIDGDGETPRKTYKVKKTIFQFLDAIPMEL